jgi:hypothetical protein
MKNKNVFTIVSPSSRDIYILVQESENEMISLNLFHGFRRIQKF